VRDLELDGFPCLDALVLRDRDVVSAGALDAGAGEVPGDAPVLVELLFDLGAQERFSGLVGDALAAALAQGVAVVGEVRSVVAPAPEGEGLAALKAGVAALLGRGERGDDGTGGV
jgi:hypothetical protein